MFLLPLNGNSMCSGQFASKLTENAIILHYNFSLSDCHFSLIFPAGRSHFSLLSGPSLNPAIVCQKFVFNLTNGLYCLTDFTYKMQNYIRHRRSWRIEYTKVARSLRVWHSLVSIPTHAVVTWRWITHGKMIGK